MMIMKISRLKTSCAVALLSAGFVAAPASAIELAFSGSSNLQNLESVTGTDGIGGTWETKNLVNGNSHFAMSDILATPQAFNSANFSNGLGPWINSFQLTINRSQTVGGGFSGINTGAAETGLNNHFTVKPDLLDMSTWIDWEIGFDALASNGQFQQILFTAPTGTQLDPGTNFSTNVNFIGAWTADSGWAASYDDRAHLVVNVPEPTSMALAFMGLAGLGAAFRRKPS